MVIPNTMITSAAASAPPTAPVPGPISAITAESPAMRPTDQINSTTKIAPGGRNSRNNSAASMTLSAPMAMAHAARLSILRRLLARVGVAGQIVDLLEDQA